MTAAGRISTGGSPGNTGVPASMTWLRNTTRLKPNGTVMSRRPAGRDGHPDQDSPGPRGFASSGAGVLRWAVPHWKPVREAWVPAGRLGRPPAGGPPAAAGTAGREPRADQAGSGWVAGWSSRTGTKARERDVAPRGAAAGIPGPAAAE